MGVGQVSPMPCDTSRCSPYGVSACCTDRCTPGCRRSAPITHAVPISQGGPHSPVLVLQGYQRLELGWVEPIAFLVKYRFVDVHKLDFA